MAALVCTVASVAGGLFGYAIGYFLYETVGQWLISVYHLEAGFAAFQRGFAEWGGWIIVAKGVTPIPFKLVTIASGFKDDEDALPIRADARVLATTLKAGESAEYAPQTSRHLYLVPAAGSVEINGVRVNARDGAAIRDEVRLRITALEDSELVLVDAA